MKYVDWVQLVVDAYASNPGGSTEMVSVDDVARRLGIPVDDPREGAVANALDDLRYISALAFTEWHRIKPTAATWQLRDGLRLQSGWSELEFGPLNSDPEAVLATAVRLSGDRHDDWADMRVTTAAEVVADLGWDGDAFDLLLITEDLQAAGLERTAMGGGHAYIRIRPRYAGVVRASERVQSEWDLRLRDMVSEWETTTVEFKSQMVLGTPRRNAEFAKDINALANTKSSGQFRYLVVGYDPVNHEFASPADARALDQDRLEQVLNEYSSPAPRVKVTLLPHESGLGPVGIVEVQRIPADVPHRMAKGGGKIDTGRIYVRHGSQVETATPAEEAALIAEGDRAREQ